MTTATLNHIPVIEYVKGYCEALEENFKQHSVDMLTRNLEEQRFPENNKYYQEQLDAIMDGSAKLYKFDYTVGKKYIKIFNLQWQDACDYYNRKEGYRQGSVTAFVDKETGQVYKPASWRAPAKHVRYDMRIIRDREFLHNPENTDWAGGHLYMR
tara:strand:- start:481 stop:945 length:465 start_codon:yes stop_codon:yes gene_type:complete